MAQQSTPSLDTLAIDTIRTLSMDGVQKANSGHPGTPMALAPVIYTLWQEQLRYNPEEPNWPDRDRFVLSCGHASMLLYSTLFLAGVKELDKNGRKTGKLAVPLEELQRFRQLDSKTPGHPEYGHTTGVETTTGPLGQGVANSVGFAIAQRWLAARYNQPGFEIVRHRVWALCGDGDMMEGISSEAASIAGHLGLSNLCWIYDSNRITIEGETDLAFSEDVAARFQAAGWNVLDVGDANDTVRLAQSFERARGETHRPTMIIVHSHIGYGAPKKQDTHSAHGEPLGDEEIKGAKRNYGWPEEAKFRVPEGVAARFTDKLGTRGALAHAEWSVLFTNYKKAHPALAAELETLWRGDLPAGWEKALPVFPADAKGVASRDAGGKVLNALAVAIPWMVGGSADLAPSTKTRLTFEGAGDLLPGKPGGRNMHFGIREHAMGAIVNGMALSGLRSFGSTFLVFLDYMKPAVRLSAIMNLPALHIFTHDSIGVGEDGPTHQPIEQLATLRATPGIYVMRPCDANETAECYRVALEQKHKPSVLALTRQALPTIDRTKFGAAAGTRKGAYVLADAANPQVILIGTGSEVSLCLAAHDKLASEGVASRVVSMPCWELFSEQSQAYRDSVLPPEITARVAVEQATGFGWERWVGNTGALVCMQGFGASAPFSELQKKFGFTLENIVARAKQQLALAAT